MKSLGLDLIVGMAILVTLFWRFGVSLHNGSFFNPFLKEPHVETSTYRKPLIGVFFALSFISILGLVTYREYDPKNAYPLFVIGLPFFLGMMLWHIYKYKFPKLAEIHEGDDFAILLAYKYEANGERLTQEILDWARSLQGEELKEWLREESEKAQKAKRAITPFDAEDIKSICDYYGSPMHPPFAAFWDYANNNSDCDEPRSIEEYLLDRPNEYMISLARYVLDTPPPPRLHDFHMWTEHPTEYLAYAFLFAVSLNLSEVKQEITARTEHDFNFRLHIEYGAGLYSNFRQSKPVSVHQPPVQEVMDHIQELSPSSVFLVGRWYESEELQAMITDIHRKKEEYKDAIEF